MQQYLRARIAESAKQYAERNGIKCLESAEHDGSVCIFESVKDQFHHASWENINSGRHPDWKARLGKSHTHFKGGQVKEMQSCNSSDALLMNIFAHPSILKWKGVRDLLGLDEDDEIEFGFEPGVHKDYGVADGTEIDVHFRTRHLFCEAKLTEADFTSIGIEALRKYADLEEVFCLGRLQKAGSVEVAGYQLIRNILALYQLQKEYHDYRFLLLCDGRRGDLVREFHTVIDAIQEKHRPLREATGVVFWQEIAGKCGEDLKHFLRERYGL